MTITTEAAVWVDAEYDRDRASDGKSRYGAYVRQNLSTFAECWDGTFDDKLETHFAAAAWRVATGPVMAPGFVRCHPRVLRTELAYSYWDGALLAAVDLVTPWTEPLKHSSQWMERTGRHSWRDWVREFGDGFYEPSDEDLSLAPFLLTTSSLRLTVPASNLPAVPETRSGQANPDFGQLVRTAQESVSVVAQELNQVVGPVIQTIEQR